MELSKRIETVAGLGLVALVAAGCLLVLAPFVSAILWAAVICFATWPLHLRVLRLCRGRRTAAATLMTLLIVAVTVLPFLLLVSSLDSTIADFIARMQTVFAEGLPAAPEWVGRIPLAGRYLRDYWNDLACNADKGHSFLATVLAHMRDWLLRHGRDVVASAATLVISVFVSFVFYRDGEKLVDRVAEIGRHVLGESSQRLLSVVGRTVRGVVYGIIGTALGQGAVAAVGFAIAGVPWPLLLGLVTFFLSLIPFGAPLLWLGATAWLLFAKGQVAWAVFMLLWGFFVISGIDNFLRPYLISRGAQLPFVLVFLGALGGIMVFGLIGLFLGPTLLAAGYCLLGEFLGRRGGAAADAAPPPPAPAGDGTRRDS